MKEIKILEVIAPEGFRDEEYLEPKEIFEENGFVVVTCSKGTEVATGKNGTEVDIDIDVTDVQLADYGAIVFVGGPGAQDLMHDSDVIDMVVQADKKKMIIGAICIAPMILHEAGILEGRHVTVWNGDNKQSEILEEDGVIYTGEKVTEDENLITADGPKSAKEFAEAIVNKLEGL